MQSKIWKTLFQLYFILLMHDKHLAIANGCPDPAKQNWYPSYHLAPENGFMNNPCGLIHYGDYYHVFYQCNPDEPKPGNVHWCHKRSKDLVVWERLPIALAPSLKEDKDGCFTGSAVRNTTGDMVLIYTGKTINENNEEREVQCLAVSSDGVNFIKKGEVLMSPDHPSMFRDPKVWWQDSRWYMVVGSSQSNHGQILLYQSKDLYQWDFVRVLAQAHDGSGSIWECPNFFPLGEKQILLVSPQGIEAWENKYRNLYQCGYFLGEKWTPGSEFHTQEEFVELNNGFDFYAAQIFNLPSDRILLFGWLDMWETPMPEKNQGWAGQFSLPLDLTLHDGHIKVLPAKEIEQFRHNEQLQKTIKIRNEKIEIVDDAISMEIFIVWNLTVSNAEKFGIYLGAPNSNNESLSFFIDHLSKFIVLERNYPCYNLNGTRKIPLPIDQPILTLRIFIDRSSFEVFVNSGRATMSSRIYPHEDQRHLSLFAEKGEAVVEKVQYWKIAIPV